MNPFSMLKEDHKKVKALFKEYEDAGDRAYRKKGQIVQKAIHELEVRHHIKEEENELFPEAKDSFDGMSEPLAEEMEERKVELQEEIPEKSLNLS